MRKEYYQLLVLSTVVLAELTTPASKTLSSGTATAGRVDALGGRIGVAGGLLGRVITNADSGAGRLRKL